MEYVDKVGSDGPHQNCQLLVGSGRCEVAKACDVVSSLPNWRLKVPTDGEHSAEIYKLQTLIRRSNQSLNNVARNLIG